MQFAILVSVIIAVLLGSFLTLTHTHRLFNTKSKLLLKSIESSNSGIGYALQAKHDIKDSISLANGTIETKIKKTFWGGFQKIESTSKSNTKEFKKIALIGNALSSPNVSMYVSDQQLPLVLVGNTKIEGTAYLSDKGVKPGSIAGHYFNGNQLIDGTINYSQSELPNLNTRWINYINHSLDFIPSSDDILIPINTENKSSFFEKEKVIYDTDEIVLNESFIGNIIIKSEKGVRVSKHANLKDVTLIAPKITLEKGFIGNASFIARDSIKVEKDVLLEYPSALIVAQRKNVETQIYNTPIIISENSKVKGIIVFLKDESNYKNLNSNARANVDLQQFSTLEGQIYCQGNLQLSGTVKGSVFTEKFVTQAFGSIYVNHIYNGTILANDLHAKFCGLPFEDQTNGIIKWLY